MKAKCVTVFAIAVAAALCASAHTTVESNMVVRAALYGALTFYPDNLNEEITLSPGVEEPTTWYGFLGGDTNGWTLAEKKAAFEALALNPRGVYRDEAIEFIIKFSTVDDVTTDFVETIITNTVGYSFKERGKASDKYAWKLFASEATNNVQREARDFGIGMFYRNRLCEASETPMVDQLFVKYIAGYGTSSNRLVNAINSFKYPICVELFGEYFISITNQLLSSGQPLPWINVGKGGN